MREIGASCKWEKFAMRYNRETLAGATTATQSSDVCRYRCCWGLVCSQTPADALPILYTQTSMYYDTWETFATRATLSWAFVLGHNTLKHHLQYTQTSPKIHSLANISYTVHACSKWAKLDTHVGCTHHFHYTHYKHYTILKHYTQTSVTLYMPVCFDI